MAVNPPYQLIEHLANQQMQATPPWAIALQGVLKGVESYQMAKTAKYDRDTEATKSLITNYSLRPKTPPDPNATGPAQSVLTAGDVVSSLNRGRTPSNMSPNMAGMEAVPKMDTSLLSHILPAIIGGQTPGKEVPVTGPGGLVKPGAVPGLSENVTVTGKEKTGATKSGSEKLNTQFAQASNRARATIDQMMKAASANPQSATVKNFPILDSRYAHQQYFKELEREAKIGGIPDEELKARLKSTQEDFEKASAGFEKDLQSGLDVLGKLDPEKDADKRQQVKELVKQRLLKAYPMMSGDVNQKVK